MRIFSYNWRLAWVVVPAFIWAWLGLTVVTGAMLRPDGPGGPPPLGLKLERGLHGLHIPGILRAVREDEDTLVLVMELPPGAREQLQQRMSADGTSPHGADGQPAPELITGLGQLLGGEPQAGHEGQRGPNGELQPVIPNMPKLPAGVSIEIVEPGEIERGRPQLELLEGSRVIDLPRGDKLIMGQRWAVRVGREGARLLRKPAGGTDKLRKWVNKLRRDEGRGPDGMRGPDGQQRDRPPGQDLRRERRDERQDRRRGRQSDGEGQRPPKDGQQPPGGGERPPQGNDPPRDGQHPPGDGQRPPKDGQRPPPPGNGGSPDKPPRPPQGR